SRDWSSDVCSSDLDTQGHRKLVSAARIWEQAQRRAAQPDPCRTVLPQGAGEWAPWRLGDFQPYVDCPAREVAPLAEEVAEAGRRLTEAAAGRDGSARRLRRGGGPGRRPRRRGGAR